MSVNETGQASFELLLVTVIVISLALLLQSYFFTIFDSTKAITITKLDAVEKLSQLDSFYTIKKIDFIENNDNTISLAVFIEPALAEQLDFTGTEQKIISQTKYSGAIISTG
ncbi:hypothetical protein HZB89_01390 [archaeon]|nr:hypothetical protein [archaeon]